MDVRNRVNHSDQYKSLKLIIIYLPSFTKIPINQYLAIAKCCIKIYLYSFEMDDMPKFNIKRLNF